MVLSSPSRSCLSHTLLRASIPLNLHPSPSPSPPSLPISPRIPQPLIPHLPPTRIHPAGPLRSTQGVEEVFEERVVGEGVGVAVASGGGGAAEEGAGGGFADLGVGGWRGLD